MGLQRHEKPRKPFDVAFPLPGLLHGTRFSSHRPHRVPFRPSGEYRAVHRWGDDGRGLV